MESAPKPTPAIESKLVFELKSRNGSNFSVKLSSSEKNLTVLAYDKESIGVSSYKHSFELGELQKLNRYFRMFDNTSEIIDFFNEQEITKKCEIEVENKFAKFKIKLEELSKVNKGKDLELMLPGEEIKESDIILKLCEKVNELSHLKKKVEFLLSLNDIDEETFTKIFKIQKEVK